MKILRLIRLHPWILPTLIFTILVLIASNMHPLWGDEAETALFGRSILVHGIPHGWDGTNIMGINDAVVLNKDLINHTSPWLQYYLVAGSFLLFGESSFTARLPFILFSMLSIPLLYLFTLRLTQNRKTAVIAAFIASLSVPFILFAYQARYYSVTTFAGLLLAFSLMHLAEKKLWPKLAYIFAGILFFYANYLVFVAFYASLFVGNIIFLLLSKKKTELKRFVFLFLGLSIIIALFCSPWYFYLKPFEGRGALVFPELSVDYIKDFFSLFQTAVSPYNENNGFPILLAPLLLFVFIRSIYKKETVAPLVFAVTISIVYFFIMTLFTVIAQVDTTFVHSRYTMNIFPFLSIASAILISYLWSFKKKIAIGVFFIFIFTNLLTLQKPRSFLLDFIHEAKNPYSAPDKAVADYLKAHARDGDTAFVNIDRDHEPLIFHLRDKIRFVNRVSLTNTRIFPENRGKIPRYIYDFRDEPDWVILYSKRGNDGSFLTFDYREIPPEVNIKDDYKEHVLPLFFSDMSRPEIELRSFIEVTRSYEDQVFIYKKKVSP